VLQLLAIGKHIYCSSALVFTRDKKQMILAVYGGVRYLPCRSGSLNVSTQRDTLDKLKIHKLGTYKSPVCYRRAIIAPYSEIGTTWSVGRSMPPYLVDNLIRRRRRRLFLRISIAVDGGGAAEVSISATLHARRPDQDRCGDRRRPRDLTARGWVVAGRTDGRTDG